MALTDNQKFINDEYNRIFGRDASFGTLGGADYWVDKLINDPTGHSRKEVTRMLEGSQEGQSNLKNGVLTAGSGTLGGLDESLSLAENAAAGNVWAGHFAPASTNPDGTVKPAGALGPGQDLSNTIWKGLGAGKDKNFGTADAAAAANIIAKDVGYTPNTLDGLYKNTHITGGGGGVVTDPDPTNPYITEDDTVIPIKGDGTLPDDTNPTLAGSTNPFPNPNPTDLNPGPTPAPTPDQLHGPSNDGWWNQFDDADAFKEFLQGDAKEETKSGGMDDFMKFMMLMTVMRPGGGGGFGGSQYGYGGLNPGGVQSAYNPWDNLQTGWNFMKDAFGGGSTLNATGA